ncbi:MAG: DUF370 domain-containing protein [Negativicutes bacterium]|nr:DUF370 domain-containing protein [Negativicutes bacterium]
MKKVISIADIKSVKAGIDNEFLKRVRKANKVIDVSEGHPKSFVVTDDYVYFSAISSMTLKKRAGSIPEDDYEE